MGLYLVPYTTVLPPPAFQQLLILQVMNLLQANIPQDPHCTDHFQEMLYELKHKLSKPLRRHKIKTRSVNTGENLALSELQLENKKLKNELIDKDQKILELQGEIDKLKQIQNIEEEFESMRNRTVIDKEELRYNHYQNIIVTLTSKEKINHELVLNWLNNLEESVNNFTVSVEKYQNTDDYKEKMKENLETLSNYIANIKLKDSEQDEIFETLIIELENTNKEIRQLIQDFQIINKVMLICQIELKHEKERLVKTRKLLKEDVNICKKESSNITELRIELAVEKKNNEYLSTAYKYDDKYTGLQRASMTCDLENVKTLVENGTPVDKLDGTDEGNTAIHLAAMEGCIPVVDWLTTNKSLVEIQNKLGSTPLYVSAEHGQEEMVKFLVDKGAVLNSSGLFGTPLHAAASSGHKSITEFFIARGSEINALSLYIGTPLHTVAQHGHADIAKLLLDSGATVDARTKDRLTPLHVAAENDQLDVAKLLINRTAEVDARTEHGFTPLHLSAKYGNVELAKLLLDAGADVDAQSSSNCTPLYVAAEHGFAGVARLLLERGARVDKLPDHQHTMFFLRILYGDVKRHGMNWESRLENAAKTKNFTTLFLILKISVNPSENGENGYTPLHWTAQNNWEEGARTLLNSGADIKARDSKKQTPLHVAAKNGNLEICRLFIDAGAEVDVYDLFDQTPLLYAAFSYHLPVVDYLWKNGAHFKSRKDPRTTPLFEAASSGRIDIVKFFVERGANVSERAELRRTPLHGAALMGHLSVVQYLVKAGADIEAKDITGSTPLHDAATKGHVSIVDFLVDHGANMNTKNKVGSTALLLASWHGHNTTVEQLVKRGSDLKTSDRHGSTPLHIASKRGYLAIVKYLLKHGASHKTKNKDGQTPLDVANADTKPVIKEQTQS